MERLRLRASQDQDPSRRLPEMKLKPVTSKSKLRLDASDARVKPLKDSELEKRRAEQCEELTKLQRVFYADARFALLIVLQGRDASGKDGTIRSVFDPTNPQGCEVTSFKVPTEHELAHDFLWRVHAQVPAKGMIGIFNRSHYEDVLVARVRDIVPKSVWNERYTHINNFERMLVENDTVVLKFFLHISKNEQKRRLLDRQEDPKKNWKFRVGDLDDRARWDDYTEAYRDALRKCSTKWAPWYVVPSDDKQMRNLLITDVIIDRMKRLKSRYPKADPAALEVRIR
jgi:PPK2 family polyphosphate:nucleotide phosphotransferase